MVSKILLGFGVVCVLVSILIFSCKIPVGKCNKAAGAVGEVMLWGTLPESEMGTVLQPFNAQAKVYRVLYKEVSEATFNQKLVDALANGAGPDLILAPYQNILAQRDRLYPYPVSSLGEKAFKDGFVDGATLFFTSAGALALPIAIDPMVLFYNRTLLSKHGVVNPPVYWDELLTMVPQLTIASNGKFVESGIDLGAPNTPYAKDILMATVGQLGQKPVIAQISNGVLSASVTANDPVTTDGDIRPLTSAVRFFTQFANPLTTTYTWNQYSGNADDQFVAEKLAMYIGYSSELATLRARNPRGDFEMTYLPQTRGYTTFQTGTKMYGIASLKSSKNLLTALTVESRFAGNDIAPTVAVMTGGVPAIRTYATDPGLDAVIKRSMLNAKGWYDINSDGSTALVAAMISDIISGRQEVSDACFQFVSRLLTVYTTQ
jgi:ABC-type glycerol-3-phosphate transport system substrate-binding protein